MSLSVYSIKEEIQLVEGVTGLNKLEFVPFYNPTVLILDREETKGIGRARMSAVSADSSLLKGVYILAESDPTRGRYNVSVGLSGVDRNSVTPEGEQQTLLERVKYHASSPPSDVEDWDKAILICDWEDDIRNRVIKFGSVAQTTQDGKIVEAMRSEVHLLEKMLHAELAQFSGVLGSLNVHRNKGKGFRYFMTNPDRARYDYYIRIAMEALRKIGIDYDAPPTRKHIKHFIDAQLLAVGETVYGRFDSEAVIINEKGNAKVTKFQKNNKNATKKDLSDMQDISLYKAASAILEANGKTPNVNASKFWHAINDDKLVPIKELDES